MTPEQADRLRDWWATSGLLARVCDPNVAVRIAHLLTGGDRRPGNQNGKAA